MFGTSSDRIGTPEGQSYFATVSKNLEGLIGWPLSPYVGLSYGTFDDELRVIGGLRGDFGHGFSGTLMGDGVDVHPTVEYRYQRHVFMLIYVAVENPGAAYSLRF